MISKATDEVKVTVINKQSDGAASDTITESGKGTYREKNGVMYITYKTDGTLVMIKADGNAVTVKRTGDTRSEMRYELGKTTGFVYKTPYGEMDMKIFTEDITIGRDMIHLVYVLKTPGDNLYNNMKIRIER